MQDFIQNSRIVRNDQTGEQDTKLQELRITQIPEINSSNHTNKI